MPGNAFDAGTISATLTLERSDFTRELRAARTDAEKFERQTFNPKVGLDRAEFTRDLSALRSQLATLRDVRLNVGVAGSTGQIQQIRQQMSSLRGAELDVRVNGVATAYAQLRALREQVSALDGRTINIQVDADTAAASLQLALLQRQMDRLDGRTARLRAGLGGLTGAATGSAGALSKLRGGALILAPALIPIAGYLGSIAAGSIAMGVSVGAGIGLFAAAAGGAIKQVRDLDKEVGKAKQNLDAQKQALAQLTPGTDAYATQLEKVEQAQKDLTKAQQAYTPEQQKFSNATSDMRQAWKDFVDATSPATLPVSTTFVDAVSTALPKAAPAVKAMAPEMQKIADAVKNWTKDGGFDRFIQNVIEFGVPAFSDLRQAGTDVLTALGKMFRDSLPKVQDLTGGIKDGAENLKNWAMSGGFKDFMNRAKQDGPTVKDTFKNLADSVGKIGDAAGGMGGPMLKILQAFSGIVAAMPVSWIQAVIVLFMLWKTVGLISALFMGLSLAIDAVTFAWGLLSTAFSLSPIGFIIITIALLVGAFVLLWKKCAWFRNFWKGLWDGIKSIAGAVWDWLKSKVFNPIGHVFTVTIPGAATTLKNKVVGGWNGLKGGVKAAYNWVRDHVFNPVRDFFIRSIPNAASTVKNKVVNAWRSIRNGVRDAYNWIKDHVFSPLKTFFVKTIPGWGTTLKNKMVDAFRTMRDGIGEVWGGIKKITAKPINFVIDTVYNGGIRKVWNFIADKVGLKDKHLDKANTIKYAHGGAGPVKGGMAGLDSVNARLMPDEHVWTADEVKNAGGHGAVAAIRAAFSSTGKARLAPESSSIGPGRYGSGTRFDKGGGFLGTGIGPDIGPDLVPDGILKKGAGWIGDKLKGIVRGAIGPIANPLLDAVIKGAKSGINSIIPGAPAWQDMVGGVVTKPVQWLKDWFNADDAKHAGGANVQKALSFAKGEAGKPYIWGGVGPKGYDCSGFMSAIQNVIDGKSPYTRRWATGAFPPGAKGWKRNEKDPFTVGITNAGVGHTAGTLAGVNVESRGGKGVIVGKGARGTKDRLFTSQWGYKPSAGGSGSGRWSETATAVLRELGLYNPTNLSNVLKAIQKESGGNPNAVNNWDSNAKAGNPSKGLLQVILSTFNAYAGKYKSKGQLDPYANIYAAVRYARSKYGAGWSARMARPGGYALGGVTTPGLHMMGEKGPELVATSGGDRVFTAQETQRMLSRAGGAGGGVLTGSLELTGPVTLTVDGEQFDAHLDGRARATVSTMIHEAEGSR
ncbi:transglycosylase SLT domain-containing protein [Streptomyces olivaceus]|uniref:transglycosylase SLT domain-containing protein n=1 Tax=Streptomyces olivaceus TaxID=47716 RepID=UPI001CCF9B9D|nr:transglycosylase SLT domain-containing protein [Streptomyces olivaceus]MBZ6252196.1 transglycosylase SLT domain-containing protein [Streptomyces olivaceus]